MKTFGLQLAGRRKFYLLIFAFLVFPNFKFYGNTPSFLYWILTVLRILFFKIHKENEAGRPVPD